MIKITVKKSYKGYVSVKSSIVDECIIDMTGLIITYNKKKMTIPYEKLNKHVQLSKQIYQSNGISYKLYDYFFVQDKER